MRSLVMFNAILFAVNAVPFVDRNSVNIDYILRRPRRDQEIALGNTKYSLKDGVPFVSHQVNLADSNGSKLDASRDASKDFHDQGPHQVGDNLNYAHQPSVSEVGLSVNGGGTKVGATGITTSTETAVLGLI